MKITREYLKTIIKEEIKTNYNEQVAVNPEITSNLENVLNLINRLTMREKSFLFKKMVNMLQQITPYDRMEFIRRVKELDPSGKTPGQGKQNQPFEKNSAVVPSPKPNVQPTK